MGSALASFGLIALYGANVNAMDTLLAFFEHKQWVVVLLLCALAAVFAGLARQMSCSGAVIKVVK